MREWIRKTWLGRLIEETIDRSQDDWTPDLGEEVLELHEEAERITLSRGFMPGKLFLTDKRLIFEPLAARQLFGPSERVDLQLSAVRSVRKGLHLSRGFRIWPFFRLPGFLPGLVHVSNLSIQANGKRYWFRVIDPDRWERVITSRVTSHAL